MANPVSGGKMTENSVQPLRYQPDMEHPEPEESETAAGLNDSMQKIREKTYADSGHATRSVHAKSHGLLLGQLQVLPNLAAALAQGLFSQAGSYPVVMRFSTIPGDILDDNVSTPRGLAIKLVGVPGERVSGSENQVTQDFVLVNAPVFGAPNTKSFLKSVELVAVTTDRAPGAKKALSATLRGVERVVEAFGGKSATLITLGGHPETNPLGDSYFSQAPVLYGDYVAKIAVAPISPYLRALTNAKVDLSHKPNGLREALLEFFRTHAAEWELRVQLCTDREKMPVEDSSIEWPTALSPYVAVARIRAEPQVSWSEARSRVVDDGYSFSPWHALAAHRPLGSIMRARKRVYENSARFRAEHNGVSVEEPRTLESLPS
jgi:Catalase